MIKTARLSTLFGLLLALLPSAARASGGSSMPPPSAPSPAMQTAPQKSPEEQAIDLYNAGIKMRDKAVAFLKEAAEAPDEKQRTKLENKARKEFDHAVGLFRQATEKNPMFYQASSDLGFALRKTGDYAGALEAYNRALSLAPTYPNAIEYRGEAYLELDRVEDAKQAYMQLFTFDRGRADELIKSMKSWVEKRQTDPGKLAPEAVQEFSKWVQQREEIAGQTPSVSQLQERKW